MLDQLDCTESVTCEESTYAICESNLEETDDSPQSVPAAHSEDTHLDIERSFSEARQATIRGIVSKNLSCRKPTRKSTRNQAKLNVKGRMMHRCDNNLE